MSIVSEMDIIQEEINRINPLPVMGEQSEMVQSDMKQWGIKNEMWSHQAYWTVLYEHAIARGWTQDGFTGMEIVEQ